MPEFTAPDGARLYYTDQGSRPPVLALSGLSRNGTDFDYAAPHLADTRLIRLDYRGRGQSEWTGAKTYTIPTEAGDALALLDHLGLERAAILGTSRGGLIAMTLAAMAKARLIWRLPGRYRARDRRAGPGRDQDLHRPEPGLDDP